MADEPYFTPAELRDAYPDITVMVYPDTAVDRARRWVEAAVDRTCETSFVYRTATWSGLITHLHHERRIEELSLPEPYLRTVTAVTIDGTVLTAAQMAAIQVDSIDRILTRTDGGSWLGSTGNATSVEVTYTAGALVAPPEDLKQACVDVARYRLLQPSGQVPDRALSMTNEFGNIQLAVAGVDRPTGLPEADAVILGYARRYRMPAIG